MNKSSFYQNAFHDAPFGYACFKININKKGQAKDATCVEVNPAFEELTRIKAADIHNRKLKDVAPELVREGYDCVKAYNTVAGSNSKKEFEIYFERLEKWFKIQIYSPEEFFLIAIFVDITQETQQRADYEGVSGRLNAIMKAMPDILFVMSKDGDYRDVYAPDESLLLWPANDVRSRTLFDLFPSEEAERHLRIYRECIEDNELKTINYSLDVRGIPMFFEARLIPLNDDELLATVRDVTEQTHSNRALTETVKKYRELVEEINDVIYSLDAEGIITYMSPVIRKLTGFKASDYVGKHFSEFIYADDLKKLFEDFELLKSGIEKSLDYRITKKTGGTIWVRTSTKKLVKNNNVIEFRGLAQDITKQKKSEQELKDSEERFKALHNASFGGVGIHEKGVILECNQGLSDMTGYSMDELIGMNGLLLIAENKRDYVMDKILAGYEKPYEAVGLRKDGSTYPLRIEGKNVPYKGKQVRVTEFRDISDQKKNEITQNILANISKYMLRAGSLEDLLEHARQQLNQLFDTKNFFMAYYDADTDMLKRVLFKDEKDEFTEWKAGDTFSGWVVKNSKTLCLKRPEIQKYAAKKGLALKGSIPEAWLGIPLVIQNNTIGVIVIQSYTDKTAYDKHVVNLMEMLARDISIFIEREKMFEDLRKAKEQAEESDRLKSAFLANMSHEIRTPMNGILGFAELLKEPDLEGEKQKKFIGIIEKSGQRMLNLINDLVDISKIESGQMEVYKTDTEINEQLYFAYDFFKPEFDKKNILLKMTLPSKKFQLHTDKQKLNAILTNLLKNAVKYTDKGEVSFGFRQTEACLEFFVQDTGIGIAADKLEHVFDRFVQADSSSANSYEGAGLGLAIVKAYVEMLGGKIWVESEPEKGSTFYFTVPC